MITFYPGPSKVDKNIAVYYQEACQSGILEINHRSQAFMALYSETNQLLKRKLTIPDGYQVFFTSSATECWEIIAQSFENRSLHLYNGSFGEKWFTATKKIKKNTIGYQYDYNQLPDLGEINIMADPAVVCLTQNETSNGTCLPNKALKKISRHFSECLLAVDATSSMGGTFLSFELADIWFASVQKCFGLPAGLAILICSPKAIAWANQNKFLHYNSLINIINNAEKCQTTHTPNVANIFLLNRVMKNRKDISAISNHLQKRAQDFYQVMASKTTYNILANNPNVRSETVFAINGPTYEIDILKSKAMSSGFMLGNGYGSLKNSSFRVANFPAITKKEMNQLIRFLDKNLS